MKNIKLFSRSKKDPDTLTARSMILPIAFCLVCGVLLILFGNLALRITAYVLAGVMILCGIWSIIAYMRYLSSGSRNPALPQVSSCWSLVPCWLSTQITWRTSCPSSGAWPFSLAAS